MSTEVNTLQDTLDTVQKHNVKGLLGLETDTLDPINLQMSEQHTWSVYIRGNRPYDVMPLLRSFIITTMLNTTPDQVQFVLIDGAGHGFNELADNPFVKSVINGSQIDSPIKISKILNGLVAQVIDALDQIQNDDQFQPHHETVLIINESASLLKQFPELLGQLEYILKMGRRAGMRIILSASELSPISPRLLAQISADSIHIEKDIHEFNHDVKPSVMRQIQQSSNIFSYKGRTGQTPYVSNKELEEFNDQIKAKYE